MFQGLTFGQPTSILDLDPHDAIDPGPGVPDDSTVWAEQLGIELWEGQREIHRVMSKRRAMLAVKACNSSGKTMNLATLIAWWGVYWPLGTAEAIVTGPGWSTIADGTMGELRSLTRQYDLPGRVTQSRWYVAPPNGGPEVLLASARAIAAGRRGVAAAHGKHAEHLLVCVEEADGLNEDEFHAIGTWCAGGDSRLVLVANPRDEATPYGRACRAGSGYEVIHISAERVWADETKSQRLADALIQPSYADRIERTNGKDSALYWYSVKGEFPPHGSAGYIGLSLVREAWRQERRVDDTETATAGLDVAKGGGDATEMYIRWTGGHVRRCPLMTRNSDSADLIAQEISGLVRENRIERICVDAFGNVGPEVVQKLSLALADTDVHVDGILTGETIGYPVYDGDAEVRPSNVRALQMWYLRGALREKALDLDPDDQWLADEITSFRLALTERDKMMIESKETTAKRIGRSPDRADALLLTFAPSHGVSTVRFHM